jgi:hypothetical protein
MRWVAADANRCAAGKAIAAADLLRAGGKAGELRSLSGDLSALPEGERLPLAFARRLTVSAEKVTDQEVACLVKRHGERQVMAMVLLLAYAGFQDRLLLALGLHEEAPPPPLEVRFKRPDLGTRLAAPRPPLPARPVETLLLAKHDQDTLDLAPLRKEIEKAQSRRPRIALPRANPDSIRWGEVCRTYQPELANAWSACMRTFGAEAGQDPVFEVSLFWVITHARKSYY